MRWMSIDGGQVPCIAFFKLKIEAGKALDFEFSADENCQLFLGGELIAEGPERDGKEHWHKQRVTAAAATQARCLVARVYAFGKALTAYAQLSRQPGFWCSLEGDWETVVDADVHASKSWPDWGAYPRMKVNASAWWAWMRGEGEGWAPVVWREDDRSLADGEFPSMLGEDIHAYRRTETRFLFDDYVCPWAIYDVEGQGTFEVRWAETCYLTSEFSRHTSHGNKGRRDGKYVIGDWDTFIVDGPCRIVDWQYRAGRVLEVRTTGTVSLVGARFINHGYRFAYRDVVRENPVFSQGVMAMALRTLECCTHDTFMDCPYYERQMYIGDSRIEALCAFAAADDGRMARKALRCFAASQIENGNILSRYPSKIDQYIPAFSVIFILMLHDFACWQDGKDEVASLLPCAERIMDYLFKHRHEDGLYYPEGWNFIDWSWPQHGVPYGSECGTNSPLNLFILNAMRKMAALERYVGAKAAVYDAAADALDAAIWKHFLIPETGLLADDLNRLYVSEHSQVLALLLKRDDRMIEALSHPENFLTTCGIYFNHYYLEACRKHHLRELFDARMAKYAELLELGLKTVPEHFISPRSDCHAWSAHILFHYMCMNGMAAPRRVLE